MLKSLWQSRLIQSLQQRNACLLLAIALLALNLLQALILWSLAGRWQVVVVPTQINKSFWVSSQSVSADYLSEMTLYFASLVLNATPDNAALNRDTLLRYTDSSSYGKLKAQLIARAERLQAQSICTAFYPVDVQVDTQTMTVTLQGDLKTLVGLQVISSTRQNYQVRYTYHQGRLLVLSFDEIPASTQ